jgi:sortase B
MSNTAVANATDKKRIKRRKFTYSQILRDIFPQKRDNPTEAIRKCIFLLAITAFALCLFYINEYVVDNQESENLYTEIAQNYGKIEIAPVVDDNTSVYVPKPEDPAWKQPLIELNVTAGMVETNPDYIGFLQIEDTKIQYPVVQRKGEDGNKYYLSHAFDGSYSKAGTLFLDYREDFDVCVDNFRVKKNSENLVIYGHEMKDGQLFGSLKQYKDNYGWYGKHPVITLDSRYNRYKYKIFAVCIVDADRSRGDVFNYNNIHSFADEKAFYEYVNGCKRRSYILNDVDVKYGDQLLTLSTCNQMFDDARLIVVARLVRDGEDELEGTQDSTRNQNILMPDVWYKYNNGEYDPSDFVPYGSEN